MGLDNDAIGKPELLLYIAVYKYIRGCIHRYISAVVGLKTF